MSREPDNGGRRETEKTAGQRNRWPRPVRINDVRLEDPVYESHDDDIDILFREINTNQNDNNREDGERRNKWARKRS